MSDLRFTWKTQGEDGQENGKGSQTQPIGCEVKVKVNLVYTRSEDSWASFLTENKKNRSHVHFKQKYYFSKNIETF